MARSLSSSCKNFNNVVHYAKNVEDINTIFEILAHHDKVRLQGKWHNSDSYIFGIMHLFMSPFEEVGVYCFAYVSRYVGLSVGR